MDTPFIVALVLLSAAAYALAFAAGTALVEILAGPWRRAAGAHWTERARLAFAPGAAVIWLAAGLPSAAALLAGVALTMLSSPASAPNLGFWLPWLAAFAGVLTARYRWIRELWGARVTVRFLALVVTSFWQRLLCHPCPLPAANLPAAFNLGPPAPQLGSRERSLQPEVRTAKGTYPCSNPFPGY